MKMRSKLHADEIVLDSASTINLFGNPGLLTKVHVGGGISVNGVGGELRVETEGTYSGLFDAYLNHDFDVNILSLALVEDLVNVTRGANIDYDADSGALHLNIPDRGYWHFRRRDDLGGLRVASSTPEAAFVTVADNRKKYAARQLKGADDAREISRRLCR